jgi:hypothetical protein
MQVPNHHNQLLSSNILSAFQKPNVQPEMVGLLFNLQQTVAKQQLLLKLLLLQKQRVQGFNSHKETSMFVKTEDIMEEAKPTQKLPLLNFFNREEIREEQRSQNKKMVEDSLIIVKREESMDTEATGEDFLHKGMQSTEISSAIEESGSEEEEHRRKKEAKVIRRNGFKGENRTDDGESEEGSDGGPRKSNKMIIPKRPPSKAKHLWINYGRKIIEFAVNHTKDDVQSRIKQLIGKLSSKKDFEDVFEIKPTDSECDKAFKVLFGKLALFFVKFKADAAFEGSKYREQMVTQKTIVASWISKLISEPY